MEIEGGRKGDVWREEGNGGRVEIEGGRKGDVWREEWHERAMKDVNLLLVAKLDLKFY